MLLVGTAMLLVTMCASIANACTARHAGSMQTCKNRPSGLIATAHLLTIAMPSMSAVGAR